MLSDLDPHSSYLNKEAYQNLKTTTTGEFGGLGIEIEMRNDILKVVSPIDDTPAFHAGVKAGDIIVKIDDTPVKGMTIRDAVKRMRGKKGTDVTLTILRKDEMKPLGIKITRDVIKIKSVKGKLIDKHYAYVRISHFQIPTAKRLRQMVHKLQTESGGKLYGMILDLRNNPGGLLSSAVDVSDAFLDSTHEQKKHNGKLIVYTKGRIPGSKLKAHAKPGDILKGKPMVILINSGSASGSEIVAGALQDHHRAIIIGERTFGKGSVQTVLPLDHEHGIKLTTALYYTPSGRAIQAKGIVPDISIENIEIPEKNGDTLSLLRIREVQLRGHLSNTLHEKDAKVKAVKAVKAKTPPVQKDKPLIHRDFQLYQALNLLKAMNLVHQQIS